MTDNLVIGTVRAHRNGRHVVAMQGGGFIDVVFDGEASPKIGGDVIGMLRRGADDVPRMTLRRTITEALIDGRTTIAFAGANHEKTARLLAKVLARSRTALISPGAGLSIERYPKSIDPDLDWAVSIFGEEADRLGVALNVIDVDAVAKSPWRNGSLGDTILPADAESRGQVMNDLTRLLRSGFHPDCNRMIETFSGENEISVNFVLPYSPFAGTFGFCREISGMGRRYIPDVGVMSVSDARRISSARHLALGIAHARLGVDETNRFDVSQSRRASHMASCFADAAAVLAFLSSGGDRRVAETYADLKESSLIFGSDIGTNAIRPGVLTEATHRSIRQAMKEDVVARATSPKAIVTEAVRIARRSAMPAARFRNVTDTLTVDEYDHSNAVAKRLILDVTNSAVARNVEAGYRAEIRSLAAQHSSSDLAASRLVAFGSKHSPIHLMNIFDRETSELPRLMAKEAPVTRQRGLTRRAPVLSGDEADLEFDLPIAP
jgi:hypothetical protein